MANETKVIDVQITGIGDAVAEIQRLIGIVDKLSTRQSKLDKTAEGDAKQYASLTAELKMYRTQLNAVTKETAQAIAVTNEKAGYLEQLEQDVRALEKAYYRLSEAEFKGTQGKTILENLKKQRAALAAAQADYGKYSMNVGNYASATNMLAINVGQVMKEMPNFAISARTGIMALTNNLPMLAEAIEAVRVQQQMMIAEGQKAPSMFKLIAGSVFGLTGVMSILMVLMQVFGGRIIEWIGGLFKSEEALKANTKEMYNLKTSVELFHETMKSGGGVYKDAISSIEKHKAALNAARHNSTTAKAALDEYNKSLGVTFGKATNVNDALLNIEKSEKAYIEAMRNMALANSFFAYSADKAIQVMEAQSKTNAEVLGESSKKYIDDIERAQKRLINGASEFVHVYNSTGQKVLTRVQIPENRLRTELNMAVKAYNDAARKAREEQIGAINDSQETALEQAKKYYNTWAKIMDDNKFIAAQTEDDNRKESLKTFDFEMKILAEKAKANEDDMLRDVNMVRANYEKKRQDAQDHINKLEALAKNGNKKAKKELAKAREEQKEYLLVLAEAEAEAEFDIIEKYIDKRIKLQRDFAEASMKMLQDSLAYDEWLGNQSLENQLKLNNIKKRNQMNYLSDMLDIAKDNIFEEASVRKQIVEQQMKEELAAENLTEEQKLAIRKKAAVATKQIEIEKWQAVASMAASVASGIADILGKETKMGKFSAAAAVTIESAQAAFSTGATAAKYFAAGNIPMGLLAAAQTGVIIGKGIKTIKDIYAVKEPDGSELKSAAAKTTVTEKFHTGTYRPASPTEEQEITRTLLTTERVLSPAQTSIFDSIIGRMQSFGGSSAITSGIGVSQMLEEKMIQRAMTNALMAQKAPVMSWTEFQNQAMRQKKLRDNAIIR